MPDLKVDHPHLYRRVRTKAIVHLAIGLDLLLYPGRTPSLVEAPVISQLFSLTVLGALFVILGIAIVIGLFRKEETYLFARYAIWVSAFYCLLWAIALAYLAISTPRTVPIAILWCYWVNNLFVVARDPGWNAIAVVKSIKEKYEI